ncbi:MAG: RNA 2',3'-cyclic phosphodiesterase [Bacillota bacterium]|nr:RNA 2',3'-cyclic phosphodiesterase [Bacillota bacterium]
MRLFIAINFDDNIKKVLAEKIKELKNIAEKGTFTDTANLHLTLAFLGEVNTPFDAQMAIEKTEASRFIITLGESGKFYRDDGDIYWVGIKKNEQLNNLQKDLSNNLKNLGFKLEDRKFTPHITLARRVICSEKLSAMPEVSMTADKISLMKSERINGKLIYTEIYNKKL